jgi:hypothetical protein
LIYPIKDVQPSFISDFITVTQDVFREISQYIPSMKQLLNRDSR